MVALVQEGVISDGDGPIVGGCNWIIAPSQAQRIDLKFQFFDMDPDSTHMYVTIDLCSDISCADPSPWSGSPFRIQATVLAALGNWQAAPSGFVRVGFSCDWAGHSQSRFVLLYRTSIAANSSSSCIPPGSWNHIAATIDTSGSNSVAKIFLNGTLLADPVLLKSSFEIVLSGEAGIAIGRVFPMSTPFGYLSGDLDELAVWYRSLSNEEVAMSILMSCNNPIDSLSDAFLCFSFEIDTLTHSGSFKDIGHGKPSDANPVDGDKFLPWCVTREDSGLLLVSPDGEGCEPYPDDQSWGFCTQQPFLPGKGFNYDFNEVLPFSSPHAIEYNVSMLTNLTGCMRTPLVLDGNVAGRYGVSLLRSVRECP